MDWDCVESGRFRGVRNPWEIARRQSVLQFVAGKPRLLRYADIGSGDCFFTEGLLAYTDRPVYALDCAYRAAHNEGQLLRVSSLEAIPADSIDCVFLMDVLEHNEDDVALLAAVRQKLQGEDGRMVITVPAFQCLYGSHDKLFKHFRRYSRRSLLQRAQRSGLVVEECFYFYTGPLVLRVLSILCQRLAGGQGNARRGNNWWPFSPRHVCTKLVVVLLRADFALHRWLQPLSIVIPGLSLCLICRVKKSV